MYVPSAAEAGVIRAASAIANAAQSLSIGWRREREAVLCVDMAVDADMAADMALNADMAYVEMAIRILTLDLIGSRSSTARQPSLHLFRRRFRLPSLRRGRRSPAAAGVLDCVRV